MKPRSVALILGALLTIILGSVVAWSYLHNPWFGPDLDDDLFFEDEDQYQAASWTRPQNLEGPLSPADVQAETLAETPQRSSKRFSERRSKGRRTSSQRRSEFT